MNVKRFTARSSRDALILVRQAFGADAVVISTRPCLEGVEVLAMAPESVQHFERVAAPAPAPIALREPAPLLPPAREPAEPAPRATSVAQDAERLAMSTLSFQDYVRERMLRRRRAEIGSDAPSKAAPPARVVAAARPAPVAPVFVPPPSSRAATPVLHDEDAAPSARRWPRPSPPPRTASRSR
jgi:flagellar biosynthesis protein FlhF